jgi:hypothetical protein
VKEEAMTTRKSKKKTSGNTSEKRPAKRKKIVSLAEYEADKKASAPVAPTTIDVGAGSKRAGKADKPAKKRQTKRPRHSLVNAAILVLADAKEPMNAKAIVERATADGLYKPGDGKTPDATLYSAMLRDKKARFHKADRGVWTLTAAGKAEIETIKAAFAAK